MKKKIFLAGIFIVITSWEAQSEQSGGECLQVPAPSVASTGGVEDAKSLVADHRFFCTKEKCEDICDDIYSKSSNEKVCNFLSESLIQSLEETDEIFEDPDPDDLMESNPLAVSVYLDISVNPLVEHIKNYNERDIKDFLTWIASADSVSSRSVVKAISKADRNFEILEELLEEWGHYKGWRGGLSQRSIYEYALMQEIDDGGTFLDLIMDSANQAAGHWVHRFIEKAHCQFDKLCTLKLIVFFPGR